MRGVAHRSVYPSYPPPMPAHPLPSYPPPMPCEPSVTALLNEASEARTRLARTRFYTIRGPTLATCLVGKTGTTTFTAVLQEAARRLISDPDERRGALPAIDARHSWFQGKEYCNTFMDSQCQDKLPHSPDFVRRVCSTPVVFVTLVRNPWDRALGDAVEPAARTLLSLSSSSRLPTFALFGSQLRPCAARPLP